MISYLTRISQVRDELATIGEVVPNENLVQTTMNGVSNTWAVFVEALVARENLPTWTGYVMILFRRRLKGVFCRAVLLLVGRMRRMWL